MSIIGSKILVDQGLLFTYSSNDTCIIASYSKQVANLDMYIVVN